MSKFEYLPNADILVVRQGVDAALAGDLVNECSDLIRRCGNHGLSSDPQSLSAVETVSYIPSTLSDYPAVNEVTRLIMGGLMPSIQLAINRQHAFAFQYFHPDGKSNPVAVVNGSDGGAFDYVEPCTDPRPYMGNNSYDGSPRQLYDPEEFHTIEVNAGDIVVQLISGIIHRGRNTSNEPRITLGIYTS
ncbi:MAG TPA: hypothetical protein VJJ78_02245 [Candidatus Saccharimonadales bacterium]|nr:hypothetical protein [Candidatus Saccharimonadales bacterium]